jgi:hypothetical protein
VTWRAAADPGVLEALLFELLLAVFHVVARTIGRLQNWRTEEQYDKSYAFMIVAMEFAGMFAWYFYLAFGFVPDYRTTAAAATAAENGGGAFSIAGQFTSAGLCDRAFYTHGSIFPHIANHSSVNISTPGGGVAGANWTEVGVGAGNTGESGKV